MVQMKALAASLVAVLILLTATSGCLDINLAKSLLVPEEEKALEYGVKAINFNHTFESDIDEFDFIVNYSGEQSIIVAPHATQMGVTINVEFISLEFVPQEFEEYLEYVEDRFVEITLYTPKGDKWYNNTYYETTRDDTIPLIPNPEQGKWRLTAEGDGMGYGENVDFFTVEIRVNEPI